MFGAPAMDSLEGSRVAVFGVGGVGGYVVEVLARSGVGAIDVIDDDKVCLTNINRQLFALTNTVGQYKVDVAEQRILAINPRCIVRKFRTFYTVDSAPTFDLSPYDYVVDCIDTVSAKMELVRRCKALNVPIICCMGAANKIDPTAFRVVDISKTSMDPLAKVMRRKLAKEGIKHFKCVYSQEQPLEVIDNPDISCHSHCICPDKDMRKCTDRRTIPASNAFVPAAAGIAVGGEVVKDLIYNAQTWRIRPEDEAANPHATEAARRAQAMRAHRRELIDARRQATAKANTLKTNAFSQIAFAPE